MEEQGKSAGEQGREMDLEELLLALAPGGGLVAVQRLHPPPLGWLKPDLELGPTRDPQDLLDAVHAAHGGGAFLLRPRKAGSSRWTRGAVRVQLAGEPRVVSAPAPAPATVMVAPSVAPPLDQRVLDLMTRPTNQLLDTLTRMLPGPQVTPAPSSDLVVRLLELLERRAQPQAALEDQLQGFARLLELMEQLRPRRRRARTQAPSDFAELAPFLALLQGQGPRGPWPQPTSQPFFSAPPQAPPQAAPQAPPQAAPQAPPQAAPQAAPQASPEDVWSPEELAGEVALMGEGEMQRFLQALMSRGVLPGSVGAQASPAPQASPSQASPSQASPSQVSPPQGPARLNLNFGR